MPRPNLAQDAPPTSLTVGGVDYNIAVDYRVWIDVLRRVKDLISAPATPEQALQNAEVIGEIEMLVFGQIIPQPAADVLCAIVDFAQGYPEPPVESGDSAGSAPTYSFDLDLNYIIIAIQNQYNIDLSYRCTEPFHWWEFLLYFRALAGNHYILRLMEIRGYDGKDNELKRQAQKFALPREKTADDQALLDEFDKMFYNA